LDIYQERARTAGLERQLLQVQGIARTFESRLKSMREEMKQLENEKISLLTVNQDLKRKLDKVENELEVMREWLKK